MTGTVVATLAVIEVVALLIWALRPVVRWARRRWPFLDKPL